MVPVSRFNSAITILSVILLSGSLWAQTIPPTTSKFTPSSLDTAKADSELKQTKRIFGLVPNYTAVSPNVPVAPLSTRGKFSLAMHDSVDYSSFALVAVIAGQSLISNSIPEFHHGPAGYGRYYWRAFADQASGTYFTEAIVPTLTHEDPRYFTLGHGGFFHRAGYALSRVVVTRTDSGGRSFNISEIAGNGLEASLSNVYYPASERGFRKTTKNWATMTAITAGANVLKEFWPDIRHNVLRQR